MRRNIYISGKRQIQERKNPVPLTRQEFPIPTYEVKRVSVQSPISADTLPEEEISDKSFNSNDISDIQNAHQTENIPSETPSESQNAEIEMHTENPPFVSSDSSAENDTSENADIADIPYSDVLEESNLKTDTSDLEDQENTNEMTEEAQQPSLPSDDNYGVIIVVARTASGAIPIANALVTISSVIDDAVTVVTSTETGVDGRTLPIPLPSQPLSNSSKPGGDLPYSLYNIDTDAIGFYSVRNLDVPIYPGITSIQQVELIPLIEGTVRRNGNEITYNEGELPQL